MRVSKRDFLKALGLGAAAVPLLGKTEPAVPTSSVPAITDPPEIAKVNGATFRQDWYEAQDSILYDRVRLPPGAALEPYMRFFCQPIGTPCAYTGVIRNHSHTNMDGQCQLYAHSSFWVRRIHVGIDPDAAPVNIARAREYSWNFWLGQKRYAGGPFAIDMQRRPLLELLKGKTRATRVSLEFEHSKGLYIPTQACFYGDIYTHSYANIASHRAERWDRDHLSKDGNGLELIFVLEGVRWWGIQ